MVLLGFFFFACLPHAVRGLISVHTHSLINLVIYRYFNEKAPHRAGTPLKINAPSPVKTKYSLSTCMIPAFPHHPRMLMTNRKDRGVPLETVVAIIERKIDMQVLADS